MSIAVIFISLFLILTILGLGVYFGWLGLCWNKTKKWSWKPCNLFKDKIENLRLEYFEKTNSYSVAWDDVKYWGNDDSSLGKYQYFLWAGKVPKTKNMTKPNQTGITQTNSFVINKQYIKKGGYLTVIVVAENRFSTSPEGFAYLQIPDAPGILGVSFQGITPGDNITMTKNPSIVVDLKKGSNATQVKGAINTYRPYSTVRNSVGSDKCTIKGDQAICTFTLKDTDLYGKTQFIPSAQAINKFGTSAWFTSKDKYIEKVITPNEPKNIVLQH